MVDLYTKMKLIAGLIGLIVAAPGLAAEPPASLHLERSKESPRHDMAVEYYVNDEHEHEIWLAAKNKPSDRELLYKFERGADVLISPDEQWLVVNDHMTSDESEVVLFKRGQGISFAEAKGAQIGPKAWNLFAKENQLAKPPGYDHQYVEAIQWSSNSRTFLLSISGHGGEGDGKYHLDPWFCVYDVTTRQPTLNFKLMNQDAFVVEHKK